MNFIVAFSMLPVVLGLLTPQNFVNLVCFRITYMVIETDSLKRAHQNWIRRFLQFWQSCGGDKYRKVDSAQNISLMLLIT